MNRNLDDLGKLLLRLALGVLILLHGIAKIPSGAEHIVGMVRAAGYPGALGYLVFVGEVLAPVMLILGLWTRAAALVIAGNMVVAIALAHSGELFELTRSGGWAIELQGLYFFTAIAAALLGGGRLALTR